MKKEKHAGFTLVEVLLVMLIASVMTTVAAGQYRTYLDRVGPERAARVVGTYVSLTRSYAVQRRTPVSLVLDATDRKAWIRTTSETLRTIDLGEGTDFRLATLAMSFPGDSLTFSSRAFAESAVSLGPATLRSPAKTSNIWSLSTPSASGRWPGSRVPGRAHSRGAQDRSGQMFTNKCFFNDP